MKHLRNRLDPWLELRAQIDDVNELYAMALEENDESISDDLGSQLAAIGSGLTKLKVIEMFSDRYDENNAFLTIHAGAGGTEA